MALRRGNAGHASALRQHLEAVAQRNGFPYEAAYRSLFLGSTHYPKLKTFKQIIFQRLRQLGDAAHQSTEWSDKDWYDLYYEFKRKYYRQMHASILLSKEEMTRLIFKKLQRTGKNQNWLAAELGISRQRVHEYATGKSFPRKQAMQKLLRLISMNVTPFDKMVLVLKGFPMVTELKSILLAEDNPNDVELTLAALSENNLANEVVVTRDGAEALDYLYRRGNFRTRALGHPAVILLDLKMPKVDGLEVLRTIKTDKNLSMIPVVMLTSSREEQDVVNSYKLGVNAYVVKPVEFQEFIDAVKQLGVFWALINEQPPGGLKKK